MVIVILNILSEIVIIKNFLFIQIEMIYMEIFFFFIDFNFIKYYYLLDFIFKVLIKQFLIHSIFDEKNKYENSTRDKHNTYMNTEQNAQNKYHGFCSLHTQAPGWCNDV